MKCYCCCIVQDCNDALIKIRLAFRPTAIVLELAADAPLGAITLTDEEFDSIDMEFVIGGMQM